MMEKSLQKNQAVIGVGSNIEPEKYIPMARKKIGGTHCIIAESTYVKTKPVGFMEQPDFVNGAIRIDTRMDFDTLKAWLLQTEKDLGRKRGGNKFGPRTIDLDIAVWDGKIVDKDVYKRSFLRNAIHEVWPGLDLK